MLVFHIVVSKLCTTLTSHMHLEENLDDWLTEELDNYIDDDYLVFDCPGTRLFLGIFLCML